MSTIIPTALEVHTRSALVSRIIIAPGLLRTLAALVHESCPAPSRLVVVSSPTVWRLHGHAVRAGLGLPDDEEPVLVNDGEKAKTMTEDDRDKGKAKMQDLLKSYEGKIDDHGSKKEKEVMEQ